MPASQNLSKSNTASPKIALDGYNLTIEEVETIANKQGKVELSAAALEQIQKSREVVEGYLQRGDVVYGITTGFGKF